MSSYVPSQKGVEFIFYVGLVSQADTKLLQNNPTLAAGDVLVSTDGGATSNLDTLPAVTPASSDMVKVTVSTSEMNGDNIIIVFSDAAGSEWCDLLINIQTSAQSLDTMDTNIDDIETDTAVIGALGAGLTAIPYNSAWDADIQSECADALTAYDPPTKGEMDTAHALLATPAQVATELGTYDAPTKAEMDTGHGLLATEAKQDTVDTVVDGIQTDLDNATDGLGALKSLIDALNDLSAANVNAEVVDVLTVDTLAELAQGIPATTPTFKTALMLLYMALRNQITTTSSELGVYNDAGTKISKKALSDDATTFTEGKMASGA